MQFHLTVFFIGKKVQKKELRLAEIIPLELHTEEQSWTSLNVMFVFFSDSSQWSRGKSGWIANEFNL